MHLFSDHFLSLTFRAKLCCHSSLSLSLSLICFLVVLVKCDSQVKTALHGSKGHARAQKPRERKTVSAVVQPDVCVKSMGMEPGAAWIIHSLLLDTF